MVEGAVMAAVMEGAVVEGAVMEGAVVEGAVMAAVMEEVMLLKDICEANEVITNTGDNSASRTRAVTRSTRTTSFPVKQVRIITNT